MTREKTWHLVQAAITELRRRRELITPAAVAREAGISRTTLYNDRGLRDFIRSHQSTATIQTTTGDEKGAWARGVMHIGLTETLSKALIKRKLAELSHRYHPDKGGANDLQLVLNEAYAILLKKI